MKIIQTSSIVRTIFIILILIIALMGVVLIEYKLKISELKSELDLNPRYNVCEYVDGDFNYSMHVYDIVTGEHLEGKTMVYNDGGIYVCESKEDYNLEGIWLG